MLVTNLVVICTVCAIITEVVNNMKNKQKQTSYTTNNQRIIAIIVKTQSQKEFYSKAKQRSFMTMTCADPTQMKFKTCSTQASTQIPEAIKSQLAKLLNIIISITHRNIQYVHWEITTFLIKYEFGLTFNWYQIQRNVWK